MFLSWLFSLIRVDSSSDDDGVVRDEDDYLSRVEAKWADIVHRCLRYRRLARIWGQLGNFLKEAKQRGRKSSQQRLGSSFYDG